MAIPVKALAFDVFGTVVDWRGTIIWEGEAWNGSRGTGVDWDSLARAWRAGYRPAMNRVLSGERPWATIDVLHRERLDELLEDFSLTGLTGEELDHLNRVWHRLRPWPDSVAGLARLASRYVVTTLSNGSVACLVAMAKHAGLSWDCIFSADLVHRFKPDPATYRMPVDLLGLEPADVMMVAAHNNDLRHARENGLRTAFIPRREEHGPGQTTDLEPEDDWDVVSESIEELAAALGA